MKKVVLLAALLSCLLAKALHAQSGALKVIQMDKPGSIRGMSIAEDYSIWISGSNGHVARSIDTGATWTWMIVNGYEKTDFRDIHAFDSNRAIIMGIGDPAYLLKTCDGGKTWKQVYTASMPGMFLDAMDFRFNKEGICIGDPVAVDGKQRFFVIRTFDSGETWRREDAARMPVAQPGEAVFSASGSNIALLRGNAYSYAFISGGSVSNLHLIGWGGRPGKVIPMRIQKGSETTGAFSMATDRDRSFYCIGGNYKTPDSASANFVWTSNRGKRWSVPATGPSGYRSCIQILEGESLIACGPNGVDRCDRPDAWKRISAEGFHVCMVAPDKKRVVFAGAKGKIGLLKL